MELTELNQTAGNIPCPTGRDPREKAASSPFQDLSE